MKKIFLFATAAIALVACNKEAESFDAKGSNDNQVSELNFQAVMSPSMTKGYVEGAVFYDTVYDKLHEKDGDVAGAKNPVTPREMLLSAYLDPQNGLADNYFVGEKFSINANGETDSLWHHNPKIYWPIGAKKVDFLAISTTKAFSGTAIKWAENAAEKVVLDVSEAYKQDDIIYASCANRKTQDGASVALNFKHSQAWLQFQLKVADSSMVDIISIKEIVIEDINTRGELTINGGATASHSWNFDKETRANCVMDDTFGVTGDGKFLGVKPGYMDMLIPAQAQKEFVIKYTLEGQGTPLYYRYKLNSANWEAGKKYIYAINFSLYEITVTPQVTAFETVDLSSGNPAFPSDIQ